MEANNRWSSAAGGWTVRLLCLCPALWRTDEWPQDPRLKVLHTRSAIKHPFLTWKWMLCAIEGKRITNSQEYKRYRTFLFPLRTLYIPVVSYRKSIH
jgi:hypothetical protein